MKYAETHEWALVEKEGVATVGISSFAKNELGEIVYLDLPKVGDQMEQGTECAVLESTKAAADLYAPLSGTVIEVNPIHAGSMTHLNTDPEGAGWLFKIRLEREEELASLLTKEEYERGF